MEHKNLRVREDVFDKFERMRYGLRLQKGVTKTQSQLIEILINKYHKDILGEANDTKSPIPSIPGRTEQNDTIDEKKSDKKDGFFRSLIPSPPR